MNRLGKNILLLVFGLTLFIHSRTSADGYYNLLFGQSNQPYQLAFVGSAFSTNTWACVLVTVERLDRVGRPSNWGTPTTVNLSGTSSTFYSDATCDTSITSVAINSGASTAGFYVLFSTNGSLGLSASSGTLLSGNQTETITLDPYTWTGGASCSPANWATAACWKGGAAPSTTNRAIFDSNCTTNCSSTIAANIDVGAIALMSPYTGVVTQSAGVTVTVESGGGFPHNFYVAGGTFFGGTSAITDNGDWMLTGGTFTSTTGTLTVGYNFKVVGSPTFNHSNGLVQFNSSCGLSGTLTPGATIFNNVTFYPSCTGITVVGTMAVNGNVAIDPSANLALMGGTVTVKGNININGGGIGGTTNIKRIGTVSGTITGISTAYLPSLEIATTAGTTTFSGTIGVSTNFTYTSGTIAMGTADFKFYSYCTGGTLTPGALVFNNVTFIPYCGGQTVVGTMAVNGNVTFDPAANTGVSGGTVTVKGNITVNGGGIGGTTDIKRIGTVSGTVTGVANAYLPSLEIATTGGTTTFSGTIGVSNNFTNTSGTIAMGTADFSFYSYCTGGTLTPGALVFNNVTFIPYCGGYTVSGTMAVNGNVTFDPAANASMSGGIVTVKGNITVNGGGIGGTTDIKRIGTVSGTVTGVSGAYLPGLEIATTGGTTTFSGTVGVGYNFTNTSGTIAMGAADFRFASWCGGGTLTPGALTFNNVTFIPGCAGLTVSGTLAANGNVTFDPAANSNLLGGTVTVKGNITVNGGSVGGTTDIKRIGTVSGTVTGVSGAYLPGLEIATTGGTTTFSGTVGVGYNFTNTSGTVAMGAADFNFASSCSGGTLTPGALTFNNVTFAPSCAGLTVSGTMAVNGNVTFDPAANSNLLGGTVTVKGDVTAGAGLSGGTTLIKLIGTTNQTITGTAAGLLPNVQINSTGGVVSLSGTVVTGGANFTLQTGTVTLGTSSLNVGSTFTVSGGTFNCSGACGAGTACGQGTGHLTCAAYSHTAGTINP